ncbi:MAG TPA: FecR domain-containing protein, partial [Sphingobacteriaceae bacterium]
MNNEERYLELIGKYLSNNITLAETEELLEWVNSDTKHADILKDLQETWERSHLYRNDFEPDTVAAWQKIQGRLNTKLDVDDNTLHSHHLKSQGVTITPMVRYLALAAALLIFSVAGVMFYRSLQPDMIKIATSDGQKEVLLPDGSKIWLNANSKIEYPENIGHANVREVILEGEAFFEIKRDPERPFTVQSGDTETRVLGTSFNIKELRPGDVSLAVISGKVSFKGLKGNTGELILLPGERAEYSHKGYLNKSRFNNTNFMYWRDKKLQFNNARLSSVLRTLSETYGVRFHTSDAELLQKHITTSFENN